MQNVYIASGSELGHNIGRTGEDSLPLERTVVQELPLEHIISSLTPGLF
jgi:hypothetical protein